MRTFRIEIFGKPGFLTVLIFAPVIWYASDNYQALIVAILLLLAALVLPVFLCTVAVSSDGIVLYRHNRARWHDFTSARKVSFLGLPYLKVQRKKGIRWSIPLFLSKPEEFRAALAEYAPPGNPLREYAEGNI